MSNQQNTKPELPKDETLRKLIAQLMSQRTEAEKIKTGNAPKPIEEYKFWKTQPVSKFETGPIKQGPLEVKTVDQVARTPQNLPQGFEWCTVDITKRNELEELYDLLYGNYVEDDEEHFRFKYPVSFLDWALTPPGWNPEFSIGIRASESKKLLAFISAIPVDVKVRGEKLNIVEINFLCVHKKLRSKRMAPVLIKEATRRVNLTNVWQALFTAGALIPTPISTARYYHRTLNWSKLYDVGFAFLPSGSSRSLEVARSAVPTSVDLTGFRKLEEQDIPQVTKLLNAYLEKFDLHQVFSEKEALHWFSQDAKNSKPVMSFVVEDDHGIITDFVSAYGLESSVLGQTKHESISIAYSYYYASIALDADLKPRLEQLFRALLVEVKMRGYDVLNALTVLDNPLFLESLNFKAGDGLLNYNLFNWAAESIPGGIDANKDVSDPGGLGVILL